MRKKWDIPTWVQLLLACAITCASAGLLYGDVKGDLRVEASERRTKDEAFEDNIKEIKEMLKEEMNRHHPRQ